MKGKGKIFQILGTVVDVSFEKKEDLTNKDKFQEIYDFLQTKIKPSFQKDLILDYKWYYSHAKEFTHVVYTTLKYLKGISGTSP
jgi:F0F1-type ATP synthase beta subunit